MLISRLTVSYYKLISKFLGGSTNVLHLVLDPMYNLTLHLLLTVSSYSPLICDTFSIFHNLWRVLTGYFADYFWSCAFPSLGFVWCYMLLLRSHCSWFKYKYIIQECFFLWWTLPGQSFLMSNIHLCWELVFICEAFSEALNVGFFFFLVPSLEEVKNNPHFEPPPQDSNWQQRNRCASLRSGRPITEAGPHFGPCRDVSGFLKWEQGSSAKSSVSSLFKIKKTFFSLNICF